MHQQIGQTMEHKNFTAAVAHVRFKNLGTEAGDDIYTVTDVSESRRATEVKAEIYGDPVIAGQYLSHIESIGDDPMTTTSLVYEVHALASHVNHVIDYVWVWVDATARVVKVLTR